MYYTVYMSDPAIALVCIYILSIELDDFEFVYMCYVMIYEMVDLG